jgi:hypothetical protein
MTARPYIDRISLSFESSSAQPQLDKRHTQTLWRVCMIGAVSQSKPSACARGGGQ